MVGMRHAEPARVLPRVRAALAEDLLDARVVVLRVVAEVDVALVRPPVVAEAGQRARILAHVVLAVAAARAEREQLHHLAAVVLVRRVLAVVGAVQPEQHRRVARSPAAAARGTSRARARGRARSGRSSAAASRRPGSRWRTSRARRAPSARREAARCAPSGRATTGGRGPTRRRGRAGAPSRRAGSGRRGARVPDRRVRGRRPRAPAWRAARPRSCAGRSRPSRVAALPGRGRTCPR